MLPTFGDKLHACLISTYVAIAGIYWLPGINANLIAQAKIALFGTLVIIGLARFRISHRQQSNLYFLMGLCAAAALTTNIINENAEVAIGRARDFIEPLLWLIALFALPHRAFPFLLRALTWAMAIFLCLAMYPVFAYAGLLPDFPVPPQFFEGGPYWLIESSMVSNSGFSASRTGWGAVLAPAALLAAVLFLKSPKPSKLLIATTGVLLIGALASMIVTGGRGGPLALVAAVAYGLATTGGLRASNIVLLAAITGVFLFSGAMAFIPDLFFRNTDAGGSLFDKLNALSTGRLASFVAAFDRWQEAPIEGVGVENARVWLDNYGIVAVHNVWLRFLAESGLLLFVPLSLVTLELVRLSLNKVDANIPRASLVIICGLVLGLLEPSVVFGSFNANAPIWTSVWIMLFTAKKRVRRFGGYSGAFGHASATRLGRFETHAGPH
ncbi:O-antigen ligase family protein [Hyphomicrobium sp. D-2]|uniref:O-antigen ligase family protein n=1 Tax=Hyphomicrobium sp. D-2 TaxID=3041621 RepID=UPI0024551792|nr:O-antigen ligase family protein [Hyphomicrobium sp. D-2]MDH4980684.1 O-antigen ligase family protein [Hyphomicrobium sp. D-2]